MEIGNLEIKVDTTEIDEALKKLELLCERTEKAQSMLAVTVAALVAATEVKKPVSRRSLLGMGLFKKPFSQ